MRYKIALTSTIWPADYSNVRRFNSRQAQEEYFDVASKFTDAVPERNLNAGTLVNLQIYVKTGEAGIGNIMENNYAIIKELDTGKFYYYFITNATFDSVNQVRLDLQLDIMQTYYIDMTFNDAMIERAHLNRWSEILSYRTIFDKFVDSKFLVRDEIQGLPKRVKSVSECTTTPFAVGGTYSNFLDENVYGWVYAFFEPNDYEYDSVSFNTQMWYERKVGGVKPPKFCSPYVVVCCPVMVNPRSKIQLAGHDLSIDNFFEFVRANAARLYGLKFTQFSPFASVSQPTCIMPDEYTLNIQTEYNIISKGTTKHIAVVQVQYLNVQSLTKRYELPQWNLTKESISTYDDDLVRNPKAFNTDYRELKIVYGGGEYTFDIQKLWHSSLISADSVEFTCFEILTPEIAPTFISVIPTSLVPVYNDTTRTRIGYLAQNDFSIPYTKNQLDVFLANNKNFFAQKQLNYNYQTAQRAVSGFMSALSGAAGAAVSGATGNIGGAVSGGLGTLFGIGTNILQNEMSIWYDKESTKNTLNNMQAGIDSLANSNSNVFFTAGLNNVKIQLVELEALPIDLGRALEDMHENGYVYNRMGNPKDFDSIRKKWNYVKARIELIKTPVRLPNQVRELVKQIFARGVRFWETDDVTFHQTNLE